MQALEPMRSSDFVDMLMIFVSALGNGGAIFVIGAAVMLCFKKSRKTGLLCGTSLIFDFVTVNLILKPLVGRIRPFIVGNLDIIIALPQDYSFPSGHTAAAFAFAAALIPSGKKCYIPAMIFAAVMGFSRIYLGVHYLTDVLVGAAVGFICGRLSYFLWKHIKNCGIIDTLL